MTIPGRAQLQRMIRDRCVKTGGQYTLASGQVSSTYVDMRKISTCSDGASLIGEVLFYHTFDIPFRSVGGLAIGAVPLVTSLANRCHHYGAVMCGFWVRNATKKHGAKRNIDGVVEGGVLIVDDVVTSGQSTMKAVEAVREEGYSVLAAVSIVDREQGGAEYLKSQGVDYRPIFRLSELVRTEHF